MHINHKQVLLCFIVLTALLVTQTDSVIAAPARGDVISTISDSLGLQHLISQYVSSGSFRLVIDAIIYAIIFMGLTRSVFAKRFSGSVWIGLGLVLTFAMIGFEYTQGFSILQLGWYAALIVFGFLAFSAYEMFKRWGLKSFAAAAGYIIFYLLILQFFGSEWFNQNQFLGPIFTILFIIALYIVVIQIIGLVSKKRSSGGILTPSKAGPEGVIPKGPDHKKEKIIDDSEKQIETGDELSEDIEVKMSQDIKSFDDLAKMLRAISNVLKKYIRERNYIFKGEGKLSPSEIEKFNRFRANVNNIVSQYSARILDIFNDLKKRLQTQNNEISTIRSNIRKGFDDLFYKARENETLKNKIRKEGYKELDKIDKEHNELQKLENEINTLHRKYESELRNIRDIKQFQKLCDTLANAIEDMKKIIKHDIGEFDKIRRELEELKELLEKRKEEFEKLKEKS